VALLELGRREIDVHDLPAEDVAEDVGDLYNTMSAQFVMGRV
jgi:hypothetical protein